MEASKTKTARLLPTNTQTLDINSLCTASLPVYSVENASIREKQSSICRF
jgi:hypothetical protein